MDKHASGIEAEWPIVALASIVDAVIVTDALAQVTFMNAMAEVLTGYPRQGAFGKPVTAIFALVHQHSGQAIENPVTKALNSGTTVGLTDHSVLLARDGTERPLDRSAAFIGDESGKIVGIVLVVRDITERQSAEHIVAEARAYAEGIVETAGSSVIPAGKP